MRVSHETIYTDLYVLPRGELKREWLRALRHRRKHRRVRRGSPERRGTILAMLSIEERPAEVAERTVPGHWEGELIVGRRNATALGTLVERTTRTTLLVPLRAKVATSVRQAFAREMRTLPQQRARSPTYDQGKEMVEHELFTHETRIQVYLPTHIVPGSEARTRSPTASSDSSSRRARTSRGSRVVRSSRCELS